MKVRELIHNSRVWLVLMLLGVGFGGFGCGSLADEPENASSKPWDSPEGYQNGNLPSSLQQPH